MSSKWGNDLWYLLHTLTMNYPEKPTQITKKTYKLFLSKLFYIIPCPMCQREYMLYLKKHPPKLDKTNSFIIWMWNFHNSVNNKLGKNIISLETCKQKHNNINHSKNMNTVNMLTSYHFHDIYKLKEFLSWLQLLCYFYPNMNCRNELSRMYAKFYDHGTKLIQKKYINMLPYKYKMRMKYHKR